MYLLECMFRLSFRWFAGRCLDGYRRTNATFIHPGSEVFTFSGRASSWSHRPGYQRSLARNLGTLLALVIGFGLIFYHDATETTIRVVGWVMVPVLSVYAIEKARDRKHKKKTILPLHRSMAQKAGHSAHANPDYWLKIPRGYHDDPDKESVILLGEKTHMGQRQLDLFAASIASKMSLTDPDIEIDHTGRTSIHIRSRPAPPNRVDLAMVRQAMIDTASGRPVLGLGPRDVPITVDLDADSPHVLISAGTGGGKTVTLRAVTMQVLHNAGLAVILDIKRVSHAWARGLENVHYARDIEEIHNAFLWADAEVMRRYRVIDDGTDLDGNIDPTIVGPRLVLIVEEINATMGALQAYWREIRDAANGDPSKSPAVQAFHNILFMGRQGLVHVLTAGQMGTAKALGGGDARENFATRILARATAKTWAMLAPEIKPIPKKTRINGRVDVVQSGVSTPCQVILTNAQQARDWSTNGVVASWAETVNGGPFGISLARARVGANSTSAEANGSDDGGQVLQLPVRGSSDQNGSDANHDGVTLTEAVRQSLVSCTRNVLKNESTRDPEFPEPVGIRGRANLYSAAELRRWETNRQAGSAV